MSTPKFTKDGERLVIAGAVRTPIGQAGKSYANMQSFQLGEIVVEELFKRTGLKKDLIDTVVAGEIGQSSKAPNVARVISVKCNLPLKASAITVANNCVSGYEAIFEACRRILTGENEVALVVGEESMSSFPIYLDGVKRNSKTATVDKLMKNWAEVPNLPEIKAIDAVEEGLNDPVRDAMMFTTAEIVAQKLGLTQAQLDKYAHSSYKKAYDAIQAGKYAPFVVPVDTPDGKLENDEYIMSKVGFVEKPERFEKAPVIYEKMPGGLKALYEKFGSFIGKTFSEEAKPAVTLFNACPQNDGAGALIVTTESKAKELGLKVQAYIKGWGYDGVDPSIMGLGIAHAMNKALENTGLKWEDIGFFEIHEAFAATALGSMVVVRDEYGHDLVARNDKGDVNRNGGTLALGHPLGATGIRVAINQILEFDHDKNAKYSMGSICAGGGVGGALILERA